MPEKGLPHDRGQSSAAAPRAQLAGLYFLVVTKVDGEEDLRRQGRVAAEVGDGYYLIDVQEWALGRTVRQELATLEQMKRENWRFYPDMPAQQAEAIRRMSQRQRRA